MSCGKSVISFSVVYSGYICHVLTHYIHYNSILSCLYSHFTTLLLPIYYTIAIYLNSIFDFDTKPTIGMSTARNNKI